MSRFQKKFQFTRKEKLLLKLKETKIVMMMIFQLCLKQRKYQNLKRNKLSNKSEKSYKKLFQSVKILYK